jgi:release factor glutamine methyltransferase
VIEVALERTPRKGRTVDIGCGSGAIAVTWQLETGCRTVATDISFDAVVVGRRNSRALGAMVEFVNCDLASAMGAEFDIVLSNPPYIPNPEGPHLQREVRDHEPAIALFGGPTGVEIYERLLDDAARIMRPGGWIVMEIGYQAQERIEEMMGEPWGRMRTTLDLAGWPRVMSAQWRP